MATPYSGSVGEPYITRKYTPRRGYRVAVPRPEGGFARKDFYAETTLREALTRAVAWRDATHLRLHGLPCPERVFHRKQTNSSTRIPGVREVVKVVKTRTTAGGVSSVLVPVILAEIWLQPGKDGERPRKSRSKLYSIKKHGRRRALAMAKAWRKQQEKLLAYGGDVTGE